MSGVSETVCALADLAPCSVRRFVIAGIPVAVVRIDDDVYAIGDVCSHANVSLSEGEVWCDEMEIECPKHSSTFVLLTGEPVTLPATQRIPVFTAQLVDDAVTVTVAAVEGEVQR